MRDNTLEAILSEVYYGDNVEDEEFTRDVRELIRELYSKYEFLGCGRNRAVFKISPFNVVKVPLCYDGAYENSFEGNARKDVSEGIPMTRVVIMSGIVCVVMEYIEPTVTYIRPRPEWVDFVDCQQVGYNRKSQLLAYDFA